MQETQQLQINDDWSLGLEIIYPTPTSFTMEIYYHLIETPFRWWFQTLVKLSDGVVENQLCMYTGSESQPNLKQYCSIKVLEYNVHTADPVNHPDKGILQVLRLEVVKTAEVRDLFAQRWTKIYFLGKRKQKNWKSRKLEKWR